MLLIAALSLVGVDSRGPITLGVVVLHRGDDVGAVVVGIVIDVSFSVGVSVSGKFLLRPLTSLATPPTRCAVVDRLLLLTGPREGGVYPPKAERAVPVHGAFGVPVLRGVAGVRAGSSPHPSRTPGNTFMHKKYCFDPFTPWSFWTRGRPLR